MSYQIALNFEDGVTRFIECSDGELVSDASYRARINIPLDCRDGVCGTCKSFCESGRYEVGDYVVDEAMTEDEEAEGCAAVRGECGGMWGDGRQTAPGAADRRRVRRYLG